MAETRPKVEGGGEVGCGGYGVEEEGEEAADAVEAGVQVGYAFSGCFGGYLGGGGRGARGGGGFVGDEKGVEVVEGDFVEGC